MLDKLKFWKRGKSMEENTISQETADKANEITNIAMGGVASFPAREVIEKETAQLSDEQLIILSDVVMQEEIKRGMTHVVTSNPADNAMQMDASGEKMDVEHVHKWQRGILPGGKYIKTCVFCGKFEEITQDQWNNVA